MTRSEADSVGWKDRSLHRCNQVSGEGSEEWLTSELATLYEKAASLSKLQGAKKENGYVATEGSLDDLNENTGIAELTLPGYLQKQGATSNQVKKFLATAMWYMAKNGKTKFQTKDVSAALSTAQQGKLSNPSVSLANNIKKGFVEKDGDSNYITPIGKTSLGLNS